MLIDKREYVSPKPAPQPEEEKEASEHLPSDLWAKIVDHQKQGGIDHLNQLLKAVKLNSGNCVQMLEECHSKLNEEKAEDQKLREKFGETWTMEPSDDANKEIRQRLDVYRENILKAVQTDLEIKTKLRDHKDRLCRLPSSISTHFDKH